MDDDEHRMASPQNGLTSSQKKGGFRSLLRKSTSTQEPEQYQKGATSRSSVDEDVPINYNAPPKVWLCVRHIFVFFKTVKQFFFLDHDS